MDLKRLMHNVSYGEDHSLYISLLKKTYNLSHVQRLLHSYGGTYTVIGEGIVKTEVIEKLEKNFDLSLFISNFIPVRNEDELKALQHILSEGQVQIETDNEDVDKKIKLIISKYISNKEIQEKVFEIVKESEGLDLSNLRKNMTKVYEIVESQGALTEIFQANPKLKVNKNTFVAKRDYYSKNTNQNSTNTEV